MIEAVWPGGSRTMCMIYSTELIRGDIVIRTKCTHVIYCNVYQVGLECILLLLVLLIWSPEIVVCFYWVGSVLFVHRCCAVYRYGKRR